MQNNFINELKWRGALQDIMPGTEDLLNKESCVGYIGFDPTADSLHIGSLLQIITLMRFQKAGHKPIALIGGATGMIGDPSGKTAERNLLDEDTLNKNVTGIKEQLSKFLNFEEKNKNAALLLNNYDWMKNYSFLNFIRDVGKHLTVNYMMAKDSVKNRLESGMSFTEFSYQLLQAYDFHYLFNTYNCKLQMGGSDQWGNITSGTELIRRKGENEAFALTTQLLKKADGSKFGKSEGGNIWLNKSKTSPYKFYQFWINTSDEDVEKFIKLFTFLTEPEINALTLEHNKDKGKRILQKELAKQLTCLVHSIDDYNAAIETSELLFKGSMNDLAQLNEETFLDLFNGVPQFNLSIDLLNKGVNITELLADTTNIISSRGETRKLIAGGGISLNKEKLTDAELKITTQQLIKNKYILISKGKKNNYLLVVN